MFLELSESYLSSGGVPDEVGTEEDAKVTIAKSEKESMEERIEDYMKTGKQSVVQKSYLKAKSIYLYCINNSTDTRVQVKSMCNMAHVLTELKDFVNGERYARKALAIDHQCVKAFVRLSVIKELQSDFDSVRQLCEDALVVDPDCQYFKNKLNKCDAVDSKAKSSQKAMKGLFEEVMFDHPSIDSLKGNTLALYKDIKKDFDLLFEQSTRTYAVSKSYRVESLRNSISVSSVFKKAHQRHMEEDVEITQVFQMIYEDLFYSEKLVDVGFYKFAIPIPRKYRLDLDEPKDKIDVSDRLYKDVYQLLKGNFQLQFKSKPVFMNFVKNYKSPAINGLLIDEVDHDMIVENMVYYMYKNDLMNVYSYEDQLYYKLRK